MKKEYYHASGIIHVHSTYSDGTRSIPEIARISNELDIQFVLMTDHNTIQPKLDGLEGWYDKILLGIGCELNDEEDENHYLAFDIDEEIKETDPDTYVCLVREQGGFGIIAHPDESRSHIPKYRAYPWKIWDSECYDGIEIWNQMSEWMEGLTTKNKYFRVLHPRRSIITPKAETLKKWDKISMDRKLVGIGGVDAHGHKYKILGLFPYTVFRYKISFKTIRTHVLMDYPLEKGQDYKKGLANIFNAIKQAHCFVSHYYFGDASDFRFLAENKDTVVIMGDSIILDEKAKLIVQNPVKAETYLVRNGEYVESHLAKDIEFAIDRTGVYRIETHVEKRPWIMSNHIRVTDNNGQI